MFLMSSFTLDLSEEEDMQFKNATRCHICRKPLNGKGNNQLTMVPDAGGGPATGSPFQTW